MKCKAACIHIYQSQQQSTSILRERVNSSAENASSKGGGGEEGLLILLVTGGKSHSSTGEVSDEVLHIVFPNSHLNVYMYIKLAGKWSFESMLIDNFVSRK
jgi:hypothetical protein